MARKNNGLFSRLNAWIDSIPMVDVHSHIDGEHPSTKDAKQIVFYHYIVTELLSAGMPPDAVSPHLSFEETVKRAIPYFTLIKNTSTYWCLMTMLKELYGFEDDDINEKNWKGLLEMILARTAQTDWYREVLTEKAKIKKTFLTFNYASNIPKYDPGLFVGALRIDPLISRLNKSDIEGLGRAVGSLIGSINDFEDSLVSLFKKFAGARCVAVTVSIHPEEVFTKSNKAKAEALFRRLLSGLHINTSERRTVSSFALSCVLSLAEEFNLPFQIMLGVRRPVPGAAPPDYAISGFEPKMISSLCPLFNDFNRVKFDIFLANRVQSHELTVVAKNYPNVHVSGYWWYAFYPTVIKQFLRERLQMLPRNKINGFFSDAYVVEWSYAKASLVRLQLATVLTEMSEEGYFTEELAKSLAVDLLASNPEKLYNLV
jgi:glucuronate isomerase